jgi:hypothetical protein
MFSGLKSGSAAFSRLHGLEQAWYSMASLMDAVARMALKRRPPVAASCLDRMASMTAFLAMASPGLGGFLPFRLEVVDVEAQDVAVLDGVGDGVGVELLLEEVRRGAHGGLGVLDLLQGWRWPRRWACR